MTTSGWLTTKGSKIVDQAGNEVWLKGINWFGYNTGDNCPGCLDACNLEDMISQIASHGFNMVRLPVSCELLSNWMLGKCYEAVYNSGLNPELVGKDSLEIFNYTLGLFRKYGLMVLIDIHSVETDIDGHTYPLWYTDRIDEVEYMASLAWLADNYKDNDTIIGIDIRNEPHGGAEESVRAVWSDTKTRNNWRIFAQAASKVVLNFNPNLLVVIEGVQVYPKDIDTNNYVSLNAGDYHNTWWGGNLMGVRKYPIDLGSPELNRQIVYSVHEYGPTVFMQPWFEGDYSYETLCKEVWHDLWLYLVEEDIAPVLIGEWGGYMDDQTLKWMRCVRQLIAEKRLNYAYWCLNPDSPDTGGMLLEDRRTWDGERYAFIKELLDIV